MDQIELESCRPALAGVMGGYCRCLSKRERCCHSERSSGRWSWLAGAEAGQAGALCGAEAGRRAGVGEAKAWASASRGRSMRLGALSAGAGVRSEEAQCGRCEVWHGWWRVERCGLALGHGAGLGSWSEVAGWGGRWPAGAGEARRGDWAQARRAMRSRRDGEQRVGATGDGVELHEMGRL
jgi:hypothetical protein